MVNLQRFLYPRGWDVRLVRGVYAELLGTLLLSFIFNLTAVNSTNNAALAAGASYAVLGAGAQLHCSNYSKWSGADRHRRSQCSVCGSALPVAMCTESCWCT